MILTILQFGIWTVELHAITELLPKFLLSGTAIQAGVL